MQALARWLLLATPALSGAALRLLRPSGVNALHTAHRHLVPYLKFNTPPSSDKRPGFDEAPAASEARVVAEEIQALRRQLKWVRCLQQKKLPDHSKRIGDPGNQPSFGRLFTHATWKYYLGENTVGRWARAVRFWHMSSVLRAVTPCVLLAFCWSLLVGVVLRHLGPIKVSSLPLSLQGTAIGLLLVFRTNGSYERLAEARELWGRAVSLSREVTVGLATALRRPAPSRYLQANIQTIVRVSSYMAAFGWELAARLRDGGKSDGEVLRALLPAAKADWVADQRSPPLALLGCVRREIFDVFEEGRLPPHYHYKLEEDLRALNQVISGCERLFSSPIPPTMSRHVIRCLLIWIFTLPVVLASVMAPVENAIWVALTAYIFVGIEEVGSQVEQPFQVLPIYQLSDLIQRSVEEAMLLVGETVPTNEGWVAQPGPVAG